MALDSWLGWAARLHFADWEEPGLTAAAQAKAVLAAAQPAVGRVTRPGAKARSRGRATALAAEPGGVARAAAAPPPEAEVVVVVAAEVAMLRSVVAWAAVAPAARALRQVRGLVQGPRLAPQPELRLSCAVEHHGNRGLLRFRYGLREWQAKKQDQQDNKMHSRRDDRATAQTRTDAVRPAIPVVNPVQNALKHALSSSSLGTSRGSRLGRLRDRLLRQ